MRELLGRSLWDIFSDNHEVIAPQGKILDIGSFRGAAGFIADYLNGLVAEARYDYMDFYLGSLWLPGSVDLSPVYAFIFKRLKDQGFNWLYHFPRLSLIDMRPCAMRWKTNPGRNGSTILPRRHSRKSRKRRSETRSWPKCASQWTKTTERRWSRPVVARRREPF